MKKIKKLCDIKESKLSKYKDEIIRITNNPKYICKKCNKVSNKKKYLCKEKTL